jgi:hypothetical protein
MYCTIPGSPFKIWSLVNNLPLWIAPLAYLVPSKKSRSPVYHVPFVKSELPVTYQFPSSPFLIPTLLLAAACLRLATFAKPSEKASSHSKPVSFFLSGFLNEVLNFINVNNSKSSSVAFPCLILLIKSSTL